MVSESISQIGVLDRSANEQRASIRRVAFASFMGTAIEWYDFFLFGTASALIFPKLFFPQFSPLAGTLASFATFGVGLVARPVGGLVFGHFGDRVGRKSMLVITLLLMGGATFLLGLLPTFEEIGVLAPTFLVLLRFLQGFAVGGEWGGATLMAVEHAPKESRNFYASWPQQGVPAGLVASTTMFGVVSSLTGEHFMNWGWRVPFLFSIVLIGVGLFIRMRVLESPAFERVKARRAEVKFPLLELLRNSPAAAALAVGTCLITVSGFYVGNTFTLSYIAGRFDLGRNVPLVGLLLAGASESLGLLIFAPLADRIGKRAIAIGSPGCVVLLAFPFFWLVNTGRPSLIWFAMSSLQFFISGLYAVTGVLLSELFDTRLRYSGISFGYQMAGLLAAPAPLFCTALVHWAGGASWPVATYLAAIAFLTLIAVSLASRRERVAIIA
jgi:MHS family shikimate/dehydroshikimate transporter-like MFS transporter